MLKTLAAVGTASAILFMSSAVQAQTKWDMPTGYPGNNFHTENIRQFADDVDKATAGKLKITVHDSGSLFKANEIKRAVQGGQADIGEIIISGFSNEDPMYGVDSIPFLATGYEASKKLWAVSKAATEARLAKQGLKVLYTVAWPPQGIFSAKPINSAADLKGAKWRAYNPNTSRIAQLVGAQPVTIQAAELTQALATGAVTTFMTSSATGYDSKVWERSSITTTSMPGCRRIWSSFPRRSSMPSTSRPRPLCSRPLRLPKRAAGSRAWTRTPGTRNSWSRTA